MTLEPNQLEIDGYLIGKGQPASGRLLTPGAVETRDQDALNPVGDNRYFGRDYLTPAVWGVELVVRKDNPQAGRQALREVARRVSEAGKRRGGESVLRYNVAGETSRIYGRARNYVPDPSRLRYMGRSTAAFEFVTSDTLHYADAEKTTGKIRLLPTASGGVKLPATLPFTLSPAGPQYGLVDAGGDADTPVTITVHGPLTGKWAVTVGGRRVEVHHTLAYDRWVTIDTRKMAVFADDGSSLSGKLSRKVFLPDVRLPPGPGDVVFEGTDDTGTSWAEVTWHDAFYGF